MQEATQVRSTGPASSEWLVDPDLDARRIEIQETRILYHPPDPADTAYAVDLIIVTPAVWAASPSHPLAKERRIPISRLAEFKCGGSQSPGSSNSRLLGVESENLGMYTASHYELLLPLVLSGDSVLLAPTFIVQPYLEAGEMVILDVQWQFDAKYHFITTRAASFSPIVRELREHARAIGDQLRDDWRGVASRFTGR